MTPNTEIPDADRVIADARPDNWVDLYAPIALKPFFKLARLDRPIGTWLLYWPCAWGAALGGHPWPNIAHLILFGLGAIVMRGAGCTFNDIVDRDIDVKVARTASRPLAAGTVSLKGALAFLILQCLIGAVILFQFNLLTILFGIAALIPVAIYPFMKRITWWPQFFLGIAFNWGALVGTTASLDQLPPYAILFYLAGIAWTIGYDTIYAHQDIEDDALIGVKSTARLFGANTRAALAALYGLSILLLGCAGALAGFGMAYFLTLGAVMAHMTWQIIAFRYGDGTHSLYLFKSNRTTGALVFLSLLLARLADPLL
jgi:4-hydroxybenzoate polyprenyltransferase